MRNIIPTFAPLSDYIYYTLQSIFMKKTFYTSPSLTLTFHFRTTGSRLL